MKYKNKKVAIIALLVFICTATTCIFVRKYIINQQSINDIISSTNIYTNNDNSNIEYISVKYNNGSSEEHWKDLKNLLERVDYYKNDKLYKRLFVIEEGRRVICLSSDNNMNAITWSLPSNIANENKSILAKSIIKESLGDLKIKKWNINKYTVLKNGAIVKKLYNSNETIYYNRNDVPVRHELFSSSKLIKVEEYKKYKDESKKVFEFNSVAVEVPMPK